MAAPSMSQMSESQHNDNEKGAKSRRVWNPLEELCLINALRELVATGMKCDNGFRGGYLTTLEKAMAKRFPGTDLRGEPHIQSKIHVWRRTYGTLTTILSRSGIGWNDSTNTLDVESEEAWKAYVLTDRNVKSWRYKSWTYFKDWEIIFGKDRATGEVAQTWQDVINEDAYVPKPIEDPIPTEQDEIQSVNKGAKSGETSSSTKQCKRKRSRGSEVHNPHMVEMMSSILTEMNSQIGALVTKVGVEKDAKGQRQNLIKELDGIPLTLEDKIKVAKKICANANDMDIFYGLGAEQRATMVRMVLDGTYFR